MGRFSSFAKKESMARKKEPSRFGALLTGAALGAATAAGIAYWLNQSPQSTPAQMRRSRALDRALQRARNESAAPLQTGQAILRTIVVGERDPHKLATLRNYRCKKDEDEIAKALIGTLCYAQDKPGGRNISSSSSTRWRCTTSTPARSKSAAQRHAQDA
jgi:hypothetical protein